jgi:antitoxin (DNA-binding transcriptional repressor) of toxin-antitoxin stability system
MADMPTITARELNRRTGAVLQGLKRAKTDTVVTYRGRAVARLVPMTDEEWEDYALSQIANTLHAQSVADEKAGRTKLLSEVMRDLGIQSSRRGSRSSRSPRAA